MATVVFPSEKVNIHRMIRVSPRLNIDDKDITERFIRASGPGGQNVNKLSSAVELRFDVRHFPYLSEDVKNRLIHLAGSRMTKDGVLVLLAQRFRTQERNREDARERLVALIRAALPAPRKRIKTRPTRSSKEKRLKNKVKRSHAKNLRAKSFDHD